MAIGPARANRVTVQPGRAWARRCASSRPTRGGLNPSAYPGHSSTTEKYSHFNTFSIEMYGPHIAILVLSTLARLNLVVSSTTCASDSSQVDHVILEITSLGAPEICCHRSGATSVDRQSTFTASDHREVPVAQGHWQSVESAAFHSGLPTNRGSDLRS